MKHVLLTIFLTLSLNAYSVTINGISYDLNFSSKIATVTGSTLQNVVVPATIVYDDITFSVTSITANSFSNNTTIKSFKSTSIKSIEKSKVDSNDKSWDGDWRPPLGAFYNAANLEEVSMENLESIGAGAFYKAKKLKKIYVGNKLTSIGSLAFGDCTSLSYIVLPQSISSVYIYSLYHASYKYSSFYGSPQLKIICLNNWFNTGSSDQTIYPSSFFSFSGNTFTYNGEKPKVDYTFNGIGCGFQPTKIDVSDLIATAGRHTENLHCTFANDDMSFNVGIPYTYTINPVTLKAKVNDASRLYGDSDPQFSSSYTGFVNNEDERVITSHGSYQSTATRQSNVGTYTIKQSGATAQNYVFEYEDGTLTVNKAPLKMTANDKTMTYGSSLPTFDAKYDGLKNNETQPTWNVKPTFNTKASQSSRVGRYPITISNADAKNYQLTVYDGNLTVEKADLTVGVENKSRDYGDANPEFTLYYSGLRNNEKVPEWVQSPTIETKANRQSPVGTYTVSIGNASAANYNIKPIAGVLTINKAPLQVTPKNTTRKYGEENPRFELSYLGLKNNESAPEWTTTPIITTNATKLSSVGDYSIQVNTAEAKNYKLEKKTGTLTITKAPLTAMWVKNYTRKYGETNPKFELSYTGLVNNESAPLWTEFPVISTVATAISDVGEYAITVKGGEMRNYEIDKITPGVLTVTPAPLRVSAMNTSRLYFEDNPPLTYSCYGFAGNDNESVFINKPQLRTEAKKNSKTGVYPITISGASTKNYTLSYNPGELTIMKRELTVSTKDYTRAYGEENPEFELSYRGFVNNENEDVLLVKPKAMTVAKPDTDTGIYDITIGNGAAENYDFNYLGAKLTIEKAYQTLTWNQDLSVINQYDQVELLATASSGLDVTYTVEGAPICNVVRIGKKQYLDCFGEGEAVIIACQEGNKNFWQSTKSYKSIVIKSATGIIQANAEAGKSVKIYDAAGNRISKLQKGVNIIIMSDGTTKKVMVK